MSEPATLPQYLLRNAANMPRRVAFREKRRGIWQALTWRDYAEMVRGIAAWLSAQGFAPGERLAVLGENRPQLYAAMLAAQALGGAGVPLYPEAETGRIAHAVRDCRASVAITEETEQAAMLLTLRDRLPDLVHAAALSDLVQLKDAGAHPSGSIDAGIAQRAAQDVALLLYPWEPDKLPRPVALTHADLLGAAERIIATEVVRPSDRALAYLPLASLEDAIYTQALALKIGFSCNCPEGPDTVPRDLHEIGPTILVAPPRLFELLADRLDASAAAASPLKRRLYSSFTRLAEQAERRREMGLDVPLGLRIACSAGEFMIHAPVRDQLGLGQARWMHLGDAPLAPPLARRFRAIGVPVRPSDGSASAAVPTGAPAHV
jgi:long-chain acyl-CoA synthetase